MKITSAKEVSSRGTIKLTITIPWLEIKKVYQKILQKKAQETEVSGFRKGKAPLSLVKKKIPEEVLFRETLQEILPPAYAEAIKEHGLKPIVQPKIRVTKMEEGQDWQFETTTCEKPKMTLGNYREAVKNALGETKIWVPGKEEKKEKESKRVKIKKLLAILLKAVKIELPEILIEEEVNRSLATLLDQINKLGLTLDAYLSSIVKSVEQLKTEYRERAEKTLKLEFILGAIADDLKVEVKDEEIEKMIKDAAKDEKEKGRLAGQKYYLASILRRQKTIDNLLNL